MCPLREFRAQEPADSEQNATKGKGLAQKLGKITNSFNYHKIENGMGLSYPLNSVGFYIFSTPSLRWLMAPHLRETTVSTGIWIHPVSDSSDSPDERELADKLASSD